jgi:hypothetical protein
MSVLNVQPASEDAVRKRLEATGLFEYIERDALAEGAAIPNDPSYPSQWHLPKVQAPAAWDLQQGSSALTIAVIDSGVDTTHPDLAGRLIAGWNFVTNSPDIVDNTGHGTGTTGVVAAATNNATGVAGVNWQSKIMPLVVLDSSNYASYSRIASAIYWAADHGARIINISIGGSMASFTLQNAVDYAWSKGAVVFASAMNNSANVRYYPAACNNVVAVSATDKNDNKASWSNFGNWIALSAPGASILTTARGGGYAYKSGTSFASPMAAAVASLVLSAKPSLAPAELVAALQTNADDLGTPGKDDLFGYGRVNAWKAVSAVIPPSLPVTVAVTPGTAALSAGQTRQFVAIVGGTTNSAVNWSVSPSIGTISASGLYTAPPSIASPATVAITAQSLADPAKTGTAVVTLTPVYPAVTITLTPPFAAALPGAYVPITATVSGATNQALTWTLSPALGTITPAMGGGGSMIYSAPASVSTTATVTVRATSVANPNQSAVVGITLYPRSALTPVLVNAGGPGYIDSLGRPWQADNLVPYFSVSPQPVQAESDAPLYLTDRYNTTAFEYTFTLPYGAYSVRLRFAETEFTAAGKRKFHVEINGQRVLANYDIVQRAGQAFKAVDAVIPVNVFTGSMTLRFVPVLGNPKVNAFEIF